MKPTYENADQLFAQNLQRVVDYMGDRRTSDRELRRAGKHFLGPFLRGVYPMGKQPPPDGTHHAVIVRKIDEDSIREVAAANSDELGNLHFPRD